MIESVQARQRGAFDFEGHYDNLCAMQDSCPLPAVKAHLGQGVLDLNGDRVRANDWQPILNTLRINKNLEFIAFRSYYQPPSEDNEKKALIEKRKMPAVRSKEITYRLCKALKECLVNTPTLSCLELQGLPLRERDLSTLMKGLVKNTTLNHLSLEYCRIGDTGLEIVCKGIKNSTTINSVNFTGCSLTGRGSESLAKVIKHQAMKRHNEAWRDSLRYRRPDLDRMPGIRRITINNNPMLGDQGTSLLAEALKDDLWLKALDLQGCGISTTGAKALLDVLKYNTTVVVLDVRRNPLIDREVVHSIMEQLMINCNGQDTEYKWIKADDGLEGGKFKSAKKRRTKTLNSSFGRKATIRISAGAARRRTKSAGAVGVARRLQLNNEGTKSGMPWRTAARANRYRGFPPEHIPGKASLFENSEASPNTSPDHSASVLLTHDDLEDEDTLRELEKVVLDDSALATGVNSAKELQIELIQMKRQLQQERLARAKCDKKIIELSIENRRLQDDYDRLRRSQFGGGGPGGNILDDDSTLESIEGAFKQFHQFLDLLKDAGLGQLITMAGLDHKESPFVSASQLPVTKGQSYSQQPKSSTPYNNSTASRIPPRPAKPITKTNGFLGDISSSNKVSTSGFSGGTFSVPAAKDPTMAGQYEGTYNMADQAKHDELYERILQETSNAFNHNRVEAALAKGKSQGEGDTKNNLENGNSHDKAKEWSKKLGEEIVFDASEVDDSSKGSRPVPLPRGKSSEDDGPDLQKAKSADSNKAAETAGPGPREGSRMSDYNYSMDSFEQSYLSERGEVVRFDGDFDTYGSSPSPPPQIIESEDNDF
ncbi:centrosomal protein of 78 kDa-like [Argopecten irradians]|uniref:centrosomal protein of 78 kDa-like n=1 Tax=Argopecten irradians TaxID=31199 RepID=UPI0037173214